VNFAILRARCDPQFKDVNGFFQEYKEEVESTSKQKGNTEGKKNPSTCPSPISRSHYLL
jgi:hypothetical protein